VQFGKDVDHMTLDSPYADLQHLADLAVAAPLGRTAQDFYLSATQGCWGRVMDQAGHSEIVGFAPVLGRQLGRFILCYDRAATSFSDLCHRDFLCSDGDQPEAELRSGPRGRFRPHDGSG